MNNNTMYCSNVTSTVDAVTLIPNRTVKNLVNAKTYGLVICNGTAATENAPVFIKTDLGDIPVLCKAGNTMYANQLNTRVRYPIMYGNGNDNYTNGQFVITSCVCPKSALVNNSESI